MIDKYKAVRLETEQICSLLTKEDHTVQPIEDVSPPKWHLAHTTWFFEQFILRNHLKNYKVFDDDFAYLFNSYYEGAGKRILRVNRGNITRPGVDSILEYRNYVDQHMLSLLEAGAHINELTELGLHHEQQHQELLYTDLKYILGHNPLFPVYKDCDNVCKPSKAISYYEMEEGVYEIGHQGQGFHYDNEGGRHKRFLHNYKIADRLVTNGEFLNFINDNGYANHQHWLSEGWKWVNSSHSKAPLYWHNIEGNWYNYTLNGLKPIDMDAPVTHVNFFESDAYARWINKRLPSEFEWEVACQQHGQNNAQSNFVDKKLLNPVCNVETNQFYGDVWEWTNSSYLPYPYFQKAPGTVGEYNGKFMINQMVLRGGSCVTSQSHIRATYRNFFPTNAQWQFSGIRLADWV